MNFINKNGRALWLLPFFLVLFSSLGHAQTGSQTKKNKKGLLQLSGKVVVYETDSLRGLPFASVIIRSKKTGAVTDYFGFFTLVASPGDVVEFVSLGYKDAQYIVPDTLKATHYSISQAMTRDTITLPTATVYPWPTKEEFKAAFLKLNVPMDDLTRAQKNMAADEMREIVKGISMDGYDNYLYTMQQRYQKMSYMGQYPPNNLLNPFAWAKFIKDLKAGKLKIK
ncbi:MAG TPA: hypothetical protein VNZ49_01735 [Bacteroidia bacterium]|nr:hypothetical protein [Bacteroidia bacterium]